MEDHTDLNESSQSMPETQEMFPSQPLSQMTLDEEEQIFWGILVPDTKDFPVYYLEDLDTKSYSFGRGGQVRQTSSDFFGHWHIVDGED